MGTPKLLPTESELLDRAREGDSCAVATLYDAHRGEAQRLATVLAGAGAADDLVAEAFSRVLARLSAGHGPRDNFRSYLFTAIRNRHRDLLRRGNREHPASDRPWMFDSPVPIADADIGDDVVLKALHSLPERWQQVLWELEVQDRPVAEIAAELGLSATALTSLAFRARRGLRTAYLAGREAC